LSVSLVRFRAPPSTGGRKKQKGDVSLIGNSIIKGPVPLIMAQITIVMKASIYVDSDPATLVLAPPS
jgi:hypothetical protein